MRYLVDPRQVGHVRYHIAERPAGSDSRHHAHQSILLSDMNAARHQPTQFYHIAEGITMAESWERSWYEMTRQVVIFYVEGLR
jgi:hypothetical protein